MNTADHRDPYAELKTDAKGYRVFDGHFENVGRVDDLYMDDGDRLTYIGVKTGLLGFGSTPIPVEIVRINDKRRLIEVAGSHERIKHAPCLGVGEELTPELEEKVRVYFGLRNPRTSTGHDSYGPTDKGIDLLPGARRTAGFPENPPVPHPTPDPGPTDTQPGKEWARGTKGHEVGSPSSDRARRVRRKKRF